MTCETQVSLSTDFYSIIWNIFLSYYLKLKNIWNFAIPWAKYLLASSRDSSRLTLEGMYDTAQVQIKLAITQLLALCLWFHQIFLESSTANC